MESKNHYKVTYFPVIGRGEFLRIALVYAGCDWEERSVGFEEFFQGGFRETTPNGYMPLLEVNGGPAMDGTLECLRYICMKEGMYSKNINDSYACEKASSLIYTALFP